MTTAATETSRPGLTAGPTNEFSLFFRVKPGSAESLRSALDALQHRCFAVFQTAPGLAGQHLVTCSADVGGGTTLTARGFFTPRG